MNSSEMKELIEKTPKARLVLEALANRRRNRPYTNLRQFRAVLLKRGITISQKEFTEVFDGLKDSAAGTFVSKNKARWKWSTPPKTVGAIALEAKVKAKPEAKNVIMVVVSGGETVKIEASRNLSKEDKQTLLNSLSNILS